MKGEDMSYLDFDFPHTKFFESDLRELIKQVFIMNDLVTNFVSINAIKYADPIQWNITKSYEKNTVVIDGNSGVAYISVRPVPAGVALTREQYWTKVFDLSIFITKGAANFANTYESEPTTTATQPTAKDKWLVWDTTLYQALTNILPGDRYVPDGNIRRMTVEDFYEILMSIIDNEKADREAGDDALELALNEEIEIRGEADSALHQEIVQESVDRENADVALGGRIDDEITARGNADTALGGRIDDEIAARENADIALNDSIMSKIGDLDNLPTTIKTNIVASINELYTDIRTIPRTTSYTTPENHGAVGDGIADDTQAINAAFEAENIVVFKNGATYLISDSINIPDGGQLLGNNATILLKAGSDIKYEEATNDRVGLITIKNVSNALVEKLTIDVNGGTMPIYADYTYVNNLGIAVENSSNVTIRGCKLINLYTEGIDTHLTSGYLNIENNYFQHVLQYQGLRKDGIYIVTHSGGPVTVKNNICDEEEIDNQYGCGGIFFANVRNATCNGNIILNCGRRNIHGHPVSAICVYSECLNIDVCNNYIKSIEGIFRADASAKISFRYNYCSFSGAGGYSDNDYIRFTYYSPSYFGYWGEYTVEGNTIMIDDNNRGAARGLGLGHDISRPLHSLRIIDNDFTMYNDAIAIYAKMNDIHIKGNRFNGTSSGSHPDIRITDGGDHIIIEGNAGGTIRCERAAGSSQVCYHLAIANNSCGTGGAAIKVDNAVDATIHDNCMNGRFEAGGGLYNAIVHDNVAHDSSSGYGYYGGVTGQHDNYYNNALVSSFQ